MQLPDRVRLTAAAEQATVDAPLVRLTRDLAKTRVDAVWWQLPDVPKRRRAEENDHGWQWAKRLGELRNDRWAEAWAVVFPADEIQGAIVYRINAKSFRDVARPAVYIEALATAPSNRPWLVQTPRYRGVGEGLLLRAVAHSYSLGFQGRLTLISFDDQRTVQFYANRGFAVVDSDAGLPMLELEPEVAIAWLIEEGYEL